MRKLKTKLLFPLLATCILMSGMTVSANTGIERSSTGEAFTLDRYNQNIYDGKMKEEVYFRPVTLTKTEKGQHLYAAEYTGKANIICPGLEDNGRKEIVAAGNIPLIPLVAPTLDDTNELEYDGHASQHLYDYLIEKYIDKVNTKIMDLVDGRDNEFMLSPENSKTNDWGTKNTPRYESINLNDLRTEEELKYDQRWLARYNIAKAIADMEEKDYERNYAFVRNAVVEMFEKNLRKTILSV